MAKSQATKSVKFPAPSVIPEGYRWDSDKGQYRKLTYTKSGKLRAPNIRRTPEQREAEALAKVQDIRNREARKVARKSGKVPAHELGFLRSYNTLRRALAATPLDNTTARASLETAIAGIEKDALAVNVRIAELAKVVK